MGNNQLPPMSVNRNCQTSADHMAWYGQLLAAMTATLQRRVTTLSDIIDELSTNLQTTMLVDYLCFFMVGLAAPAQILHTRYHLNDDLLVRFVLEHSEFR